MKKHNYEWHRALNDYNHPAKEFRHWMYEAMSARTEVERLAILFKQEREGKLRNIHKQCSMSAPEQVIDNHLTCCLGTECRKCEHLAAVGKTNATPEEIDEFKAWTCVAHILTSQEFKDTSEGYVLTTDDRMFWQNVYDSMSTPEGESP